MSALLYLTADDFYITKGKKGNLLCNTIKGYHVVLFYSTACPHCKCLIPIFKNLPGSVGNCQFAMVNVSHNKNIVLRSNDTISPIKYVPLIIFHVDGKPFMKYNGPNDICEIRRFIFEVTQKLGAKKFYEETNTKHETESKIPEYTIGIPKTCDDGVCYLEFDNDKGYVKC